MRTRFVAAFLLTSAVVLSPVTAAAQGHVTIGLAFTSTLRANSHTSAAAPDVNGAAGLHHVMEFINGDAKVYDKATGKLLLAQTSQEFWDGALGLARGTNDDNKDPRLLYDAKAHRWYASAQKPASAGAVMLFARSNGEDPTKGWKGLAIEVFAERPPTGMVDFDRLGYNANGVYLTINQMVSENGKPNMKGVAIFSFKKSDLIKDTPVFTMTRREHFAEARDINPAIDHDGTSNAATLFGNSANLSGSNDMVSRIEFVGDLATWQLEPKTVATIGEEPGQLLKKTKYAPLSLSQPGGTPVGSLMKQPSAVHLVRGEFWMAHSAAHPTDPTRSALRWWRIRASDNKVLGDGFLTDPTLNLILPSMAVDAQGNVVIACVGVSPTQPLSAYAIAGRASGDTVTFDPSFTLVKAGTGVSKANGRWGDYTTTVSDPDKPGVFWTFVPYTQASGEWATYIAQLTIVR
jgi:hypothetical protein